MRTRLAVCLMALTASVSACTKGAEAGFRMLDPVEFKSFVANWAPDDQPLCAAFASEADWNKVMHPAATMGGSQVFAPPATLWNDHAVLLLSRVIPMGDTSKVFEVSDVKRTPEAIDVAYSFHPTPADSASMKWLFLVEVPKPLAPLIRFNEDGKLVCSTAPGASTPAF